MTGGTVRLNLADGQKDSLSVRSITSANYKCTTTSGSFNDQLGTGKKMTILLKDKEKRSDVEIQLSLYDHIMAITIEAICKNVSGNNLVLRSIEPFRVIKNEGGVLNWPGVSKCITNGEMYYDAGTIHEFGKNNDGISSGNLKGVKLANGPISSQSETIHSWWNAGFFGGYDKEGLAIGYLENNLCLGNLLLARTDPGEISLIAESVYAPQLIVKPGQTISSNRLMINIAQDPYAALEAYADAAGKVNNARIRSVVNGWCSWFYTLAQVSEDEVDRQC